ncbi:MAG: enoyl-CoA hydratase-related protein [Pseudomonadota bacterium]
MIYHDITLEMEDGAIASLVLNKTDTRNALTRRMRSEIRRAVRTAPRLGARALVISASGDDFCSGQDLGDSASLAELDLEGILREEYEPMLRAVYECPIPVVAAVNGTAAGAGANLALAADLVIARDGAVFIEAFTRIGLIPDAGSTYWLPRQVGFARAMGAALLAEPIPAKTAAEWGMIWEVTAKSKFNARVEEVAKKLATGPTESYRLLKEAMRQSFDNTLDAQLDLEASQQGKAGRTRDFREGVLALAEKRPPKFEGR